MPLKFAWNNFQLTSDEIPDSKSFPHANVQRAMYPFGGRLAYQRHDYDTSTGASSKHLTSFFLIHLRVKAENQ